MRKPTLALVLIIVALAGSGCSDVREPKSVERLFSGKRVGSSVDYGLMKNGTDHIATFHGLLDDHGACRDVANLFNQQDGRQIWSCKPLSQ